MRGLRGSSAKLLGLWQVLMRRCHIGCEGVALEAVSPALRAVASDFSCGQRKVTNRAAIPGKPSAAPSSLTALLTLSTHLGGLRGAAIPCPTVTRGALACWWPRGAQNGGCPSSDLSSSLPATWLLMRRCRMGCEDVVLEGVSPALRAVASDFGKTQSHQRSSPPASRPLRGCPRLSNRSDGTRRRAFPGPPPLARRPALRPGPVTSPRRLAGGCNTVPDSDWGG